MKIIYGINSIQTLLKYNHQCFQRVLVLNSYGEQRLQRLVADLEEKEVIIKLVDRQSLDNLVGKSLHQGIIAYIKQYKNYQEGDLSYLLESLTSPFLLILDCVTDPHNLGACLRTADAVGIDAVIVPKNRSAKINNTVKKVACGAAETVPLIRVTNLVRTICILKSYNIWIVGTVSDSNQILYKVKLPNSLALVMGSEGEGIRRLTRKHCDELIKIPMLGNVSSLNVSVATGICLFEALRQRQI